MSTKLPVLGITDNVLQGLHDLATYKEPTEVILSRLGLHASFINAERGFNELEGVIRQSLDGVDLRGMWNEFQQTLALWNRQRQPLLNLLTRDVTSLTEKVYYPTHEDFE